MNDEQAIRDMVSAWMKATSEGDIETVMGLMTGDVVFLVAGQPPFGRDEFRARSAGMKSFHVDARNHIQEVQSTGDWGWFRSHVDVTFTPRNGGKGGRRAGSVLTIVRRNAAGQWQIARDANLLADVAQPAPA